MSDRDRFRHILEASDRIGEFVEDMKLGDFVGDHKTQSAVLRELMVIGEAARYVTKGLKEKHPDVAWEDLVEMRNMFTHEYFRLKLEDIWKIATEDIPRLRKQVEGILAELGASA